MGFLDQKQFVDGVVYIGMFRQALGHVHKYVNSCVLHLRCMFAKYLVSLIVSTDVWFKYVVHSASKFGGPTHTAPHI